MEGNFGGDIDIGNSVAVGEAERLVWFEVLCDSFQAATCCCVFTGINQGYFPRFGFLLMYLHAIVLQVEGDVRCMEKVVCKVFFDDIAFVAAADDKVVDSVGGVELHDMPEDWLASDFDHGFWLEVRLFGDAGAEASCEDDCFHFFKGFF